jgi:carbohydrate kinase (thermoresistant glucokinase family)
VKSVVVTGVSGSGKTTVGEAIAAALAVPFTDADDLHPAANIAKMTQGVALTDDDRRPWLDAVAAVLATGDVVVACSALRRSYRERLRVSAPDLALLYLHADREVLRERMTGRPGHFMPPELLDSQLETLEPPGADEGAVWLDAALPVDELVADALARLEDR